MKYIIPTLLLLFPACSSSRKVTISGTEVRSDSIVASGIEISSQLTESALDHSTIIIDSVHLHCDTTRLQLYGVKIHRKHQRNSTVAHTASIDSISNHSHHETTTTTSEQSPPPSSTFPKWILFLIAAIIVILILK